MSSAAEDDDSAEAPELSPDELEADVEAFFAPDGALARVLPAYELREEQLTIALAVARALLGRKLFAEAGTGTGKTLAYLVPVVLAGRRVVVSTATKTLQDQVMDVDVPLLARALGRRVEAQVMKGRGNYLCLARSERALAQRRLPGVHDLDLLPAVSAWAGATRTGDRAELEVLPDASPLWRELSATSEQCTGRACSHFERCFVTQMRRRAQQAQVVVANHHLYFADLALRERAGDPTAVVLPAHELVIFDEAHELEEVGAQHFGVEVSDGRLYDFCGDVLRAVGGDAGAAETLAGPCSELERRVRRLFEALDVGEGRRTLDPAALGEEVHDAWHAASEQLRRLGTLTADLAIEEAATLARRATLLEGELRFALGLELGPSAPRVDRSPEFAQLDPEDAGDVDDAADPTPYVRYTEPVGRSRAVVARPVEIASLLREQLAPLSALFVSATLSVGGSFAYVRRRLGVDDADEVVVASPFDYRAQAALYLPDDLPEPEDEGFTAAAAERAAELVAASMGGAFVLCTSHRMLGFMRGAVAATGIPTLVQGDAPKARLLEAFKEAGDAVLCATMSFWQGVDVPGRALRLVVIDRLPFASPGDPLVAARLAHLRARGLDPFTSYQLPQAALLLRQGFGRLIRRRSDRGMVALLDRRVRTRRYGGALLASLPDCGRIEQRASALAFLAELSTLG